MNQPTHNFTLNGRAVTVAAPGAARLSIVLRENLLAKGTKVGCDAGDCGACTVLINGEIACACLTAVAQVDGCAIISVEGLGENGRLSDLQQSFLHYGAAQCGICTPGMLVAAKALLDHNCAPSRRQIEDALSGVLCRCTGYTKIVDAVLHAAGFSAADERPPAGAGVGASIRHLDGPDKVTGETVFGADHVPANALEVRVIRSPHHCARFTLGDLDGFIGAHPGLNRVLSAADIDGVNCFGAIPQFADQPVFAEQMTRYRGEAVACIVGEAAAVRALNEEDFPVSWEPLDPILTLDQAMADGARQLFGARKGNVLVRGLVQTGDAVSQLNAVGQLQSGAHRIRRSFSTPFIEHAYIEPEAGYAVRRGARIEIHGCTQAAHMDRAEIAKIMGLDLEQVRIVPSACGGGFGSKLDISMQPYVALAAWVTNRPAYIVYSRGDSMRSTTKRHASNIDVDIACDGNGKITAMDFDAVFNTGAYASWGPTVANRVPVHASGPYAIANYRARSVAIHTNAPPAGAFRGFGVPQAAVAQECVFDELADLVGIDRLQFRMINALRNGEPTVTGQKFKSGVGISACFEALKPAWERAREQADRFNRTADGAARMGVGIGSCWYGCGNTSLSNPSTIRIAVTGEGAIMLHQGALDIGQGAFTVIAQIAADALGVAVHTLQFIGADTDATPDAGKTSASRQTFISGNAARLAGAALRGQILRHANVSAQAVITIAGSRLTLSDGDVTATIELANLPADDQGAVFVGQETYDPPTRPPDENGQGEPYAIFGYGAQLVELSVDTVLGTVQLSRVSAAHDVGRAINPLLVEGQIQGGVAQGIGLALMEDYVPGRTENLHDYLIPTIGDVPQIDCLIIEVPAHEGPYGAKGLGEHVLIPTAPAILNAIRDATGAAIRNLPATPDKVRAAILAARKESKIA